MVGGCQAAACATSPCPVLRGNLGCEAQALDAQQSATPDQPVDLAQGLGPVLHDRDQPAAVPTLVAAHGAPLDMDRLHLLEGTVTPAEEAQVRLRAGGLHLAAHRA